MNIARVIVDVPASVVNQTFDYKIPERYQALVTPGMRVVIPFGPRKITGFVMERVATSSFDSLKEIIEVLDLTPVLTPELLLLGKWVAKETVALYITTFQAMLPQVLKAKYKKEIIRKTDAILEAELERLFANKERLPYEDVVSKLSNVAHLQHHLEKGDVFIHYLVKSQETKRYETIYTPKDSDELAKEIDALPANATRQKEILTYFINHPTPIEQANLYRILKITGAHLTPLVKKELLTKEKREVYRDPYKQNVPRTEKLPLTDEQEQAMLPIKRTIQANKHRTFLLHGVTGSGKTEVYLQAIADVIEQGKEAIVLVPEIALTPQMVHRFKGRFGANVAVMHSALSVGEKYDEWRKIQRKEVQVVVGARSAIFAPFENLGIIIIDEEHETTYKQEETPRYHAKDVAIKRGELNNCPVVLGSATPTLEAYARAQKGVYELLTLTKRTNDQAMPPVNIVDMRNELRSGNRTMFSKELVQKINDRLEKKQQIVLLLNRRGYSTFALCRDCGHVEQCPNCDISLTYHKRDHRLKCHYCSYETGLPSTCPACQSEAIHFFGTGTERVEEALLKILPQARVIRMDVDTTRKKGAHERLLRKFSNQEADILLGTQMIAKGLDFENVTLVGVLAADSMLHLPDFRSSEKTFQLITQVSGRAGRHELAGEVFIQTYTPEHYSITLASAYDYKQFYLEEMRNRKMFRYPPYFFLALITLTDENNIRVYEAANKARTILERHISNAAIVLGPTPSPIARIKGRYRYQVLIKYRKEPHLYTGVNELLQEFTDDRRRGLQIIVDMNPFQFM